MKQSVKIKKHDGYYQVAALTNRMEPEVGAVLEEKDVRDLLLEANRIGSKLSIHIT